ncbi:hypothetical protein [Brevibacillus dissolubilis]|uniref:hypothetical protein n=1 Tax=Brevibacillus dissolubilis TaxID=1844116 RepID=UPI00111727A3|nr:hypothetical protein [Brevibacillus dissolubilis]
MDAKLAHYEREEKNVFQRIQTCNICTDLINAYVKQNYHEMNVVMLEDILTAIFKVEMEQREELIHIRLAKATHSQRTL